MKLLWISLGVSILLFLISCTRSAVSEQKGQIAQKEQSAPIYKPFVFEKKCGEYPHRYSSVRQMYKYEFEGGCHER